VATHESLESDLVSLAQVYGVATEYWDQAGELQYVGRDTVEAVLAALGVDATTADSRAAALLEAEVKPWRQIVPPVFVTRHGVGGYTWVHVPHGSPAWAAVELEDGSRVELVQLDRYVPPREVDGVLVGEASFVVPGDMPVGYHTLVAGTTNLAASSPLIVTPFRLELPAELVGHVNVGIQAQLYAVLSRNSWGIGDLVDLGDLAVWAATRHGAKYILVNPMHAAEPIVPIENSPYLPSTKRFANPLYLRVEAIPEYGQVSGPDRFAIEKFASKAKVLDEGGLLLNRDRAWENKKAALELVFAQTLTWGRQLAFDTYRAREGEGLTNFATWSALVEVHGNDWHEWPEGLLSPSGADVAAARAKYAARIRFYEWLQWQLDQQLALAQSAAESAGMSTGIVHDLAVGVHPDGADAWSLQHVLAQGISVGAPPDMYNQMGQDWSQPPFRPDMLAELGFAPYRDMLRTILRHGGGIRVDHVLGLFRLWWIPEGMEANKGTYVKFDHDALIGIACLEAQRAGAFLVGEDLGTVEPWVQEYLADRGVLGTTILWFESSDDGTPARPYEFRPGAMASVTTHDLPPTMGYLDGIHVRLRNELGLLSVPVEQEAAEFQATLALWTARLVEFGVLEADKVDDHKEVMLAMHRYVRLTPSVLQGVSIADMTGQTRPQNQPGTNREYPNWCIPTSDAKNKVVYLEQFDAVALAGEVLEAAGLPRKSL
jgi:4-alpha-glucanotransferase